MSGTTKGPFRLRVHFSATDFFYVAVNIMDTIEDLASRVMKERNVPKEAIFFKLHTKLGVEAFYDANTLPEDQRKKVIEVVNFNSDGHLEDIYMKYLKDGDSTNKVKLWNACAEELKCKVEYDIDGRWINKRITDKKHAMGVKGGVDANVNLTGTAEGKTEEHYTNDGKKSICESVDIDAHGSKEVYLDNRLVGNHFMARVFRNGIIEEELSLKPGREYVLYTHGKSKVRSCKKRTEFWNGQWECSDGQKSVFRDPHDCLKKSQQCKLCPEIPIKDGSKVERPDVEPHRSLEPDVECSVCTFSKNKQTAK